MIEKLQSAFDSLATFQDWADTDDPWITGDQCQQLLNDPKFVEHVDRFSEALIAPFSLKDFLDSEPDGAQKLGCFLGAVLGVIWEQGGQPNE
ncbi:hypothetical protein [Rhodopirellula sp. MGV]|uniref:hypothetical protein n=1 Tax=Rhodopirellula sp. MGV TaxID=2023130 RepID=UPI00117BBDF5|nr:hypothetical protein [Rhodopirellula sp. MGV]